MYLMNEKIFVSHIMYLLSTVDSVTSITTPLGNDNRSDVIMIGIKRDC